MILVYFKYISIYIIHYCTVMIVYIMYISYRHRPMHTYKYKISLKNWHVDLLKINAAQTNLATSA